MRLLATAWPRPAITVGLPLVLLVLVAIAAIATGDEVGPVTGSIESLSSSSATALGRLVSVLPLGYALGAGMVAAFNPCGFAMLPSYLGLYLGTTDEAGEPSIGRRLSRALVIGGTVTASFVLLFGLTGIVLSVAAAGVSRWLPWIALVVGIVLLFVGSRLLAGWQLYTSLGEEFAARMASRTQQVGLRGYFAYGLAYALASLSCTLPIFLAVVGSAFARNGLLAGALQFIVYALGMGLVLGALTIGVALFKQGAVRWARRVLPFVQPLSALILVAAGAYIVYYWLTVGGLLQTLDRL